MPSGTYNDEERLCGICSKKLRPLKNTEDWSSRKYHITCFKSLISDIYNYNRVCYKKYGHKKFVAGFPIDQPMPEGGIVLTFD
mgnify:CR=1 FL=1